MRLATVEQCRALDEQAEKIYDIPNELLMENAGAAAAREIVQSYLPEMKSGTVGIICGPGNNGADGLVVARHLIGMGFSVQVVADLSVESQSLLFKKQLRRLELQGSKITGLTVESVRELRKTHLVVDALLGIGVNRNLEKEYFEIVKLMNILKVPIVSLDIPSGLHGNRGIPLGAAVKASLTLTFGLAKPGFFVQEGPHFTGRLRVLPIGYPRKLFQEIANTHFSFDEKTAKKNLPLRKSTSNKSDFGRVTVVAGKRGMWGAAVLACSTAYRMGAGYVTMASFEDPSEVVNESPEILTAKISDFKDWEKQSSIVIGPGLGAGDDTADLIRKLKKMNMPVVVDADAVTTCVSHKLFPLPANWIMTPHSGELSKVMGVTPEEIEEDRFGFVFKASQKAGCVVLLKGYRTIVAKGDACRVIMSGNSALAKAGSGDVLSGAIGGLLAQGLTTSRAACLGAYLHGRVADNWVRSGRGSRTLTASDLPELLSMAFAI